MKKVLFIATTKLTVDGLTAVFLKVARIVAVSYPVGFALGEGCDIPLTQELKTMGDIYLLPSRKKNLPGYLCSLTRVIRDNHYDTVHIHGNSATMAFDLLAALGGGAETRITHCHNCAVQPWIKQQTLGRLLNRLVTEPVACSAAAGEMLYSRPFSLITNGIDCGKYRFSQAERDKIRRELQIEKAFVVGHIGRFSEQKNQMRLLAVFSAVVKRRPDAILLLIGDGENKAECMKRAQKEDISGHVLFIGNIDNPEAYYSAMDIFVLPSLFEGLPLVGVEAQASGLPCVFSDRITPEVKLLRETCFISLERSDDDWADVVCSPETADRGKAADLVSEAGFSNAAFATQVEKLYGIV